MFVDELVENQSFLLILVVAELRQWRTQRFLPSLFLSQSNIGLLFNRFASSSTWVTIAQNDSSSITSGNCQRSLHNSIYQFYSIKNHLDDTHLQVPFSINFL